MAHTESKSRLGREARDYVEFIIDANDSGEVTTYTSDPDALANFFGANPDAPNFLTQVHFKKDVLDKYFQKPSKYSVESGIVRCGYEWGLPVDNDHDDKVCAWLGDLGGVPYDEQLHWRAYNIPPSGTLSATFYANQILVEPTDSRRPEHLFRRSYDHLQKECGKHLGWCLLIPLVFEDSHHLQTLRIPSTEEQREFDELVLSLTKILIDSINVREMRKVSSRKDRYGAVSGISLLETMCDEFGIEGYKIHIEFLRKLQKLRSSGVAHRKGKNYRRAVKDLGMEGNNFRMASSTILQHATDMLDFLASIIDGGHFKKSNDVSR